METNIFQAMQEAIGAVYMHHIQFFRESKGLDLIFEVFISPTEKHIVKIMLRRKKA